VCCPLGVDCMAGCRIGMGVAATADLVVLGMAEAAQLSVLQAMVGSVPGIM
jgi:hypothetical protein